MANIDKIKEQGNQAAPLLTNIQNGKVVISLSDTNGELSDLTLEEFSGRKEILRIWGLFEKGEIEVSDIRPILIYEMAEHTIYPACDYRVNLFENGNKEFSATFTDTAGQLSSDYAIAISVLYEYKKASDSYELRVYVNTLDAVNNKHKVTAEFID